MTEKSIAARIEDVAITSVYQPPAQPRLTLAEHFQEILILLPRRTPWCCIGDHNDVPEEHVMLKDNPFPALTPYFVQGKMEIHYLQEVKVTVALTMSSPIVLTRSVRLPFWIMMILLTTKLSLPECMPTMPEAIVTAHIA